ncbi:protein FAM210B, mitochondrial isoform X1 [Tursiops truncatus]|uniref:Protein FAM210B, mitochondrial isoform X1 n=1 Tax=Tursiops truncatus TaxID=9739 RepID=A0A2U4C1S4_TURTR|nr:protein FAM210B, mitochondrial isoform X1 [Tursiops truncatus]
MAGLLALLCPTGRVGARVRSRAAWLLGAAAPRAPPPLFLPLLGTGLDAPLLHAARGNCHGRQDTSKITVTTGGNISSTEEKKQSKSQQLKKIFQEYGAVGVSLHIGISLISLGMFYMVVSRDFPGGPVVKNSPYSAGVASSIPGWGTKIPHAEGQLSPCATTTELVRLNYRAHATWSPFTTTREEKNSVLQRKDPACQN